MKRLSTPVLAFALLGVTPFVNAERAAPRVTPLAANPAETRVIVKFKEGAASVRAHALSANAAPADAARVLGDRAASLGTRQGLLLRAGVALGERVQVIEVDPAHGLDATALAARLAADPDVEYAVPNRRARHFAAPNDPRFDAVTSSQGPAVGQWYLRAPAGDVQSSINSVTAWDVHTGSRSIVVAVLDTGVRTNHPDLAGKLLPGYDFVSNATVANDGGGRDSDPSDPGDWITQTESATTLFSGCDVADSSWHGTQVSGIVAAATDNGIGMAGSGRHVRVLPVRVLGKCFGDTLDINAAMRWAAGASVPGVPNNANPAKVINLSLGSGGACDADDQDAVNTAIARGAVVVAAAGNSAGRAPGSPANCVGVIGVAALRPHRHQGRLLRYRTAAPDRRTRRQLRERRRRRTVPVPDPDHGRRRHQGAGQLHLHRQLQRQRRHELFVAARGRHGCADVLGQPGPHAGAGARHAAVDGAPVSVEWRTARPDLGCHRHLPGAGHVDQLQCYCTTSTCGAGMLDANAAVRAVLGTAPALPPSVSALPAAPQATQSVVLSSTGSLVPAGRTIVSRRWTLVDGGGIVTAFGGASDGETATLTPSAAGRFSVQLSLVDDRGLATATDFALTVSAAPAGSGGSTGGGGGGGSMSWPWLLALAAAVVALRLKRGAT